MGKQVTLGSDGGGIEYPIYAIRRGDDGWEERWKPIEDHPDLGSVRDVVSDVSFDAFEKAQMGWTAPLSQELGLDPEGCLIKVADDLKKCQHRETCIDHRPDECGPHLNFPVCFLADVDGDFEVRSLLTRLFEYWSSGRWVCVVPYRIEQDSEE